MKANDVEEAVVARVCEQLRSAEDAIHYEEELVRSAEARIQDLRATKNACKAWLGERAARKEQTPSPIASEADLATIVAAVVRKLESTDNAGRRIRWAEPKPD